MHERRSAKITYERERRDGDARDQYLSMLALQRRQHRWRTRYSRTEGVRLFINAMPLIDSRRGDVRALRAPQDRILW